ncbi:MAG: VCBS repeat-containing protein, partial [bacterium]|nr:VCBS repeat-containing protein [bacterium]
YRSRSGFLYLRQQNNFGTADISIFFGIPEDLPVCGDWNGDGTDTIGIYRPSNATFYLRYSNTTGFADQQFTFGSGFGSPFAGDFNGDGKDTVGLWRAATGRYELSNGNSSTVGPSGYQGAAGDTVVVADFDRDGRDTLGFYRSSNGHLYLNSIGEAGGAPLEYDVGSGQGHPVAGDTGGTSPDPVTGPSVPPNSISVWPGESIQTAINNAPNGSTFYIRAGTHRMQRFSPRAGSVIIGEQGAILNGARVLTGWSQDGGQWWVGGQNQEGVRPGVCEGSSPRC